ncbi:MAG TPA: transglycosylase domain-containing protein, partial [Thermoleophilaceae bacterium]|nr:transglycosylase domain-containing protein [Thermoleophilaceae bacterium]
MSHRKRKQRRKIANGRGRVLMTGLMVVVGTVAIAALSGVGYVIAVANSAPDITRLKPIDKGTTSIVYAADGSRLGYVQSDTVRTPIRWADMPIELRQGTVAIEDRRFYHHGGVDLAGIARAAFKDVTTGKSLQGGSTITQQLVRNLYIKDPKRNLERKIREAKMADDLEKLRSKQWILREYMNNVPYGTVDGRTAVGVEAASQMFFYKHAKDLTLAESALLAGLPQAPSQFNPFREPSTALERRNRVLQAMVKSRYISQSRASRAMEQPLGVRRTNLYTKKREPYFFDYVQEQLIESYGVNVFRRGGLRVYTTVDPKLQEDGRRAIAGQLTLASDPSSAVVSIDPRTGYIKAMASSGTYDTRTFNLAAQGHRQPGSAFKTMVLATAIRQGIDPSSTVYVSKPLNMNVPGFGPWKVKTYDGSYGGAMNIVTATLKSDNTVYAQLDVDVGPKEVAKTARLLGIRTKLDGLPSEGLGGLRLGVSPLEMASAYATLAAGGMYREPRAIRRVTFPDGKVDDLSKPKSKRVLKDGEAFAVTKILQMNVQRGTGTRANYGCPAAGKTGTTDNYNDAWFVGYTPSMSTSVWVGYPNALVEMRNVHGIEVAGGTFPAQIWHDYMVNAHTDCRPFPQPRDRASFSTFFGDHSASGSGGGGGYNYSAPSGADNSAGGGDYRGYDPRLYASPPQGAPPATPSPPTGGAGPGGGAG